MIIVYTFYFSLENFEQKSLKDLFFRKIKINQGLFFQKCMNRVHFSDFYKEKKLLNFVRFDH